MNILPKNTATTTLNLKVVFFSATEVNIIMGDSYMMGNRSLWIIIGGIFFIIITDDF